MPDYSLGAAHGAIIITFDGAGVAKAEASLTGLEAQSKRTAATAALGAKRMAAAGLIIAGGLAVAAHAAADFDAKMNLLVTAAGESQANLAKVSAGVQNIAIKTGTGLDQLSEGAYQVEKAGYRGADALMVLQAGAEGARAEGAQLATVTSALTSIMMSYHLHAKDAVSVTNQMVVAAGASKTTMENFANSLSTVLPVASAAGVTFPQVAGALATLTQHGTSAAEATQELASTIRNLQAPNGVAIKTLNQLGFGANDLAQILKDPSKGLYGAIVAIDQAILTKMGPDGLALLGTFNNSKNAAEALQTQLAAMPPDLQQLTQGFQNGTVSMADYRKGFRALGGPASVMGQQFLSLFASSQGFSQQIKSGGPAAETFAAVLKRVTGGAIGMNTALQLGGENLAYFQKTTDAVSQAALEGGTDIETWGKVTRTASFQFGQLKATLEVLGVLIGHTVLPAFVGVAHVIRDVALFLVGLPGPVRDIISVVALMASGWLITTYVVGKFIVLGGKLKSILIASAASFQKLGAAITGLLAKMGLVTVATEEQAAAQTAASLEIEAAAASEAAAVAEAKAVEARAAANAAAAMVAPTAEIESLFASEGAAAELAASQVIEALGTIDSMFATEAEAAAIAAEEFAVAMEAEAAAAVAAAGVITAASAEAASAVVADGETAAIGWAGILGPLAAVGIGIGFLTTLFHSDSAAADENAAAIKSYTQALIDSKGAIDDTVRGKVSMALADSGALAAAKALGVGQGDLTDAIVGNGDARNRVLAIIGRYNSSLSSSAGVSDKQRLAVYRVQQALHNQTGEFGKAVAEAKLYKDEMDGSGKSNDVANVKIAEQAKKLGVTVGAYKDATAAAKSSTQQTNQQTTAFQAEANAAALLQQALDGLAGVNLAVASARTSSRSALLQLTKAFKDNGNAIEGNGKKAVANQSAIQSQVRADQQLAIAIADADKKRGHANRAAHDELKSLRDSRAAAIAAARAQGTLTPKVRDYINKLYDLKDVGDYVNAHPIKPTVDPSDALASLEVIASKISTLVNGYHNVVIHVTEANDISHGNTGAFGAQGKPPKVKKMGGWTDKHRPELNLLHPREYVLSDAMLHGKQPVDPSVLSMLSSAQLRAMTNDHSVPAMGRAGGSGPATPALTFPARLRASGELKLAPDAQGNLRGWVEDLILDHQDFSDSLAGMGAG